MTPNKFAPEDEKSREPFLNRPTKGKTRRKRLYPSRGVKTNIGDPCKSLSGKKR